MHKQRRMVSFKGMTALFVRCSADNHKRRSLSLYLFREVVRVAGHAREPMADSPIQSLKDMFGVAAGYRPFNLGTVCAECRNEVPYGTYAT